MKILINFYLLILALAILIFFVSQTIKTNTKCFATNLLSRLCCFGINFNHYEFLKHNRTGKMLNCYVFSN